MDKSVDKIKITNCPLCKSNDYKKINDIKIDDLIKKWNKRWKFNPISNIYIGENLEKRKCSQCGIFYYNYHLSDSKEMYEQMEKIEGYYPTFRQTYKIAYDIINEIKPQNLLEIGSGNGSFLEYIKDIVPTIVGSEYNDLAVEICNKKGLNVTSKLINEIEEEFDVICHHEVLEHIFDTRNFLKDCVRLLKKNGKLIIGCPNPESIRKITGDSELHLPPHHQFDFTKKAFEWIANEFNLKICDYRQEDVKERHYKRYLECTNDNISYEECNKKFVGHAHVIVFEKL